MNQHRTWIRPILLGAAAVGLQALSPEGAAAQQGPCRDPWVSRAVQEVTGRVPNGRGDEGECNFRNYGGGQWSSYPDLLNKVRAHFASSAPAPAASGACRDAWVTRAVREVTGRAPNGQGDEGECNTRNYGGGQWSSYPDLVSKVRAHFASSTPASGNRGGRRARPRPAEPVVQYRTAITTVVHTPNGQRALCLVPTGSHNGAPVVLRGCQNGGAQYRIFNGYIATGNGKCLDYGDEGGPIHLMDCKPGMPGGTSQQWFLHGPGGQMKLQNALNTSICMDVAGGGSAEGTPVVAYGCKFGQNAHNQMFNAGEAMSPLLLALIGLSPEALQQFSELNRQHGGAAQMVFDNGMHVVAAGGGNVVAAGGGNVVAAGGLNVVAPGGGNVVAAGSLNLINIGANGVVAAGSGNVVAAGSLNLLGGARVVAAGGLN